MVTFFLENPCAHFMSLHIDLLPDMFTIFSSIPAQGGRGSVKNRLKNCDQLQSPRFLRIHLSKSAWAEHGLCANVSILDHEVTKCKTEYDLVKVPA